MPCWSSHARLRVRDLELALALELLPSLRLGRLLLSEQHLQARWQQVGQRRALLRRDVAQQVADDGVHREQRRVELRKARGERGVGLQPVAAGLEVRVDVDHGRAFGRHGGLLSAPLSAARRER
jgi:hypothetical protein